jgi:hypothetical protein
MRFYTEGEVLKRLRDLWDSRSNGTQTAIAAKLGFTQQFLTQVLSGEKPVSPNLASSLGFRECPRRFTKKQPDTA